MAPMNVVKWMQLMQWTCTLADCFCCWYYLVSILTSLLKKKKKSDMINPKRVCFHSQPIVTILWMALSMSALYLNPGDLQVWASARCLLSAVSLWLIATAVQTGLKPSCLSAQSHSGCHGHAEQSRLVRSNKPPPLFLTNGTALLM